MGIICICNYYYSNTYSNSIESELIRDSESIYFIERASGYLYRKVNDILGSLQSRNALNFDEITIVKYNNKKEREATAEEIKKIDQCCEFVSKVYGLAGKSAIRLSKIKKEIYKNINKYLGFKYYRAVKFNLTADLAINAEYIRVAANLTDNCWANVNSFICKDIYNLVFNKIVELRKSEPKQPENKKPDLRLSINEFKSELFDEYMENMIAKFNEEGVDISRVKFTRKWEFNSDDEIVKYRVEALVNGFIRIDCE